MKATASARSTVQPVRSSAPRTSVVVGSSVCAALVRLREPFVAEHQEGAARADGLGGRPQHPVAVEGHGGLQVAGHHEVPAPGGEVGLQIAAAPGDPVRDARIPRSLGPDRQRGRGDVDSGHRPAESGEPDGVAAGAAAQIQHAAGDEGAGRQLVDQQGVRPTAPRPPTGAVELLPEDSPDRWTPAGWGGCACPVVWAWCWWLSRGWSGPGGRGLVGLGWWVWCSGMDLLGTDVSAIIGRTGRSARTLLIWQTVGLAGPNSEAVRGRKTYARGVGQRRKPSVVGKRTAGGWARVEKPSVVGKRTAGGGGAGAEAVRGRETYGRAGGAGAEAVRGRKTRARAGGARPRSRPWSGNARPGRYQAVTWCARIG